MFQHTLSEKRAKNKEVKRHILLEDISKVIIAQYGAFNQVYLTDKQEREIRFFQNPMPISPCFPPYLLCCSSLILKLQQCYRGAIFQISSGVMTWPHVVHCCGKVIMNSLSEHSPSCFIAGRVTP